MQSIQSMTTRVVSLIGPLLMGLAAAYVLAGFAELKSSSGVNPLISAARQSAEPERLSWEGIIFQKNILNLEVPVDKSALKDPEPLDDMGDWKLLGTFTGEGDFALLSVSGRTKLLSRGQMAEGWELSEIQLHSTLWRSGSRTRSLSMWQEDEDSGSTTPLPRTASVRADPGGSQRVTLSGREIQPFLNDPNSLLQMAQFHPYAEDGATQGFQISNISRGSMLDKLGLQDGDVLTRIDGGSITGPTELLRAYSRLSQSTLVSMDVLRQGQNVSFVVEIE